MTTTALPTTDSSGPEAELAARGLRRGLIVGCGYAGAALAARWHAAGVETFVTTRSAERGGRFRALGWRPVIWDVLRGGDALPETDAVAYAVGNDRSLGVPMETLYVEGVRRTLHALPAGGIFVYVSSTGVYGDAGGAWVDEDTPPRPEDEGGQACLAAEATVRAVADAAGREWAIVRSAGIYGPGRAIGADAVRQGLPLPGDPNAPLNLIHRDDLAAALDLVARRGESAGIYAAADGRPPTRGEFYAEAARLLGAPPPRFDGTLPRRHRGARRVSAARLLGLGMAFAYPDHRAGLASVLAPPPASSNAGGPGIH